MSDMQDDTPELTPWSEPVKGRRPWWFWIASGFGASILFVSLLFVAMYYVYAPELPENTQLAEINHTPSITMVDPSGKIFASRGAAFGRGIELKDMPAYLPQAFIIMEDRRFYSHWGIDVRGLVRALSTNLTAGQVVQGGSTITQQLAKNTFLRPDRTWSRKLEEVFIAFWLERHYSKEKILETYLNRIYLGSGAYGIDAASREYFGKSAHDVTLAEAAMLAALTRAPSRYSPEADLKVAQSRAATVIDLLLANGDITKEEADKAKAKPAKPVLKEDTETANYFADFVMDQLTKVGVPLDKDIIVRTTIDLRLQTVAQKNLAAIMNKEGAARGAQQAALVSMQPDGAIRAIVGGKDYTLSSFNRAYQARRQPGSSFKPFVYLAALEHNLTPDTVRDDAPYENRGWSPENYDGNYLGEITLRDALAHSVNTVAVRVADEVGRMSIIQVAQRLGITSPLEPNRSLPLGTSEVTLLEMTRAFASFANNGNRTDPYAIIDVRASDGSLIYEHKASEATPVMEYSHLEEMNQMLFEVIQTGTGKRGDLDPRPAAAKTGTSQDWRDAWFVGYTADYVTGVWMGNDDNTSMNKVVGGSLPATIWKNFMVAAHKDLPVRTLPGIDMFDQSGEDMAEANDDGGYQSEDNPWVERGGNSYYERHPPPDDRGVLDDFFDSLFGSSDRPPPPRRQRPRAENDSRGLPPRETAMSAPQPSLRPAIPASPAPPAAPASPAEPASPPSPATGPYRQPQPTSDGGSPF